MMHGYRSDQGIGYSDRLSRGFSFRTNASISRRRNLVESKHTSVEERKDTVLEIFLQSASTFTGGKGGDAESKLCDRNSGQIQCFDLLLVEPIQDRGITCSPQRL